MTESSTATSDDLTPLSAAEASALSALADVMIPQREGVEAASRILLEEGRLDQARRLRPDLEEHLHELLGAVDETALVEAPVATLDRLADLLPTQFGAFGTLLSGAYVLDPGVRSSIGYPGQEARAVRDDTASYLDMLSRVVERDHGFRAAP